MPFFWKKRHFWTFWELLSNNRFRDAFYEKFAEFSVFLKKSSFFSKKTVCFFRKKNQNFEHLWDFSNINTDWNAFSKRVATSCHCQKYQVLSRGNQCNFPKSPNFWTFSDFWSNKTIWYTSLKKHATFTGFGKNRGSFQKQHLILRETRKC